MSYSIRGNRLVFLGFHLFIYLSTLLLLLPFVDTKSKNLSKLVEALHKQSVAEFLIAFIDAYKIQSHHAGNLHKQKAHPSNDFAIANTGDRDVQRTLK